MFNPLTSNRKFHEEMSSSSTSSHPHIISGIDSGIAWISEWPCHCECERDEKMEIKEIKYNKFFD